MLTSTCSHCGAVLRIPLTSADAFVKCDRCGQHAPLDPTMREKLAAARQALFNLPLHQRQLNAADRFVVSAEQSRKRVALIWSALAVPMGLVGVVYCLWVVEAIQYWSDPGRRPWLVFAPPLVLPFVVHVVLGVALRKRMLWAADEARLKLYARQSVEGGGIECRVCGAPAQWPGLERAIVRCQYCGSDNLVEPAMLLGVAKAEVKSYDALAAHVVEIATWHARNDTWRIALYLAAPLVLFGALLKGAYALDARLSAAHLPVNTNFRYVAYSCPLPDVKGKLVFQQTFVEQENVDRYLAPSTCSNDVEWNQIPMPIRARADSARRFAPGQRSIALSELVGKKIFRFRPPLVSDDPHPSSRVIAAASDAYGRNWLDVIDDGGTTSRTHAQHWQFFEAVDWAQYGPVSTQ